MVGKLVIVRQKSERFRRSTKPTLKQERKCRMPSKSRNRWQLMGVSSVTFHMVAQATSITSSKVFRSMRLCIRLIIRCGLAGKRVHSV